MKKSEFLINMNWITVYILLLIHLLDQSGVTITLTVVCLYSVAVYLINLIINKIQAKKE